MKSKMSKKFALVAFLSALTLSASAVGVVSLEKDTFSPLATVTASANETNVAKIGDATYETLEAAFAAAVEGDTIVLNSDATPTLTSQRAITKAAVIDLNDNTLTLTEDDLYFGTTTFKNGTIIVDPSVKPSTAVFWMFANQTLTFDGVKIVATGVTGTYLIGLDGNNSDLNLLNGSEILVENTTALDLDIVCVNASTGNDIVIEDSKVNVTNLDGRVFFRGNYTVSGTTEIALEGITKAGFRIEAGQTLNIEDTASVVIAGEPRDGGIHLTDVTATYTVAETATVTATVAKPIVYVAKVGETSYETFTEALAVAKTLTGDVSVEILDKVTLNQSLEGSYDSIAFVGKTENAEIYLDVQGYITATGKKVSFTNLTLSKAQGGYITNAGFMNVAFGIYDVEEVTYTNCTFANGAYASSGNVTFTECTFYRSWDKYGLWAYGDVNATVDDCTFADYRGIKMYAEGAAKTTDLTVKNTDFSAVDNKPAIVLTYGESVTLESNTYSATGVFELDLDGAPNGTTVTSDTNAIACKNDNGVCGVLVDGKIYTTVAQAAEVATEDSTVTLLHASTETVELPAGVTLDKNGYEATGVTVAKPIVGTITYCYTSASAFWGEGSSNAAESYVVELYEGETKIASASLNDVGNIIDGTYKNVTWSIPFAGSTDEYWTVVWAENYPKYDMNPDTVKLVVDGITVSENVVKWSGADDVAKIVALAEGFTGGVVAYTSLADAVGDFNGRKVNVIRDVTESIEAFNGCTLTTNVEGGVTITNTYNDYYVYANDFNIGKGVNVVVNDIFYETDGVNSVEGTLQVVDTFYHGYNATTTVQNGGSIKVLGTTILRYNTEADAGLYIYGDGDDTTVEYDCDYYIGAYSGTFYAENATIETGYFLLKNSYDNSNYANIDMTLDNSTLTVVGTTDTQDSFIIDDQATLTLKNGSSIADVRDFNVLAGTNLTLNIDETSSISATYVNVAEDVPFAAEKNEDGTVSFVKYVAKIGDVGFASVADALTYAQNNGITDLVITLCGETSKDSTDAFDLYMETQFDSITFQQEDASEVYYLDGIYTGKRTNGGSFVFDGVNIVVTGQYIFEGNVKLTNNSVVKSTAESNCFQYYSMTTIEPGSKLYGVIDDFRGGSVIVDGGRTDGAYNETPDMKDAILIINWSGSTLTVQNGAYVNVNSANEVGRVTINAGASLNVYDSKFDAWQWIDNNGTINVDTESAIATKTITGAGAINVDATNFSGSAVCVIKADFSGFTGTVVITGNDDVTYEIKDDGLYIAEKPKVAEVNGVGYTSLEEAVAAAQAGETITLLADIEQVDGFTITDKNLTIDLNDKTITVTEGTNTNSRNFLINGASVVTIKNGTLVAAGDYSSGCYGTIRTEGTANVTLTGLKLYNYRGNGLNIKAVTGTKVTISDTEIYAQYGGGIEAAGGTIDLTNVIVEQKGMYTAPYNSMAISVNGGGKVTVHSGTYTTEPLTAEDANNQGSSHGSWVVGVLNSGGTLIINDGTFANGNYGDDSLATAARGAVLADTGANIIINGGTFNALAKVIDIQNNLGDASKNPTGTITGGTFSADPTNGYVVIAEGFEVVDNGDGTYGIEKAPVAEVNGVKYTSLEEATAAAVAGDTITLLANVTLSADLTLPAGITFNGNGFEVSGATIWASGDLTFVGYNKVTMFNAGYNKPTITIGEGATLEFTTGRMVIGHGATFNITGSIVDAKTADKTTVQPSLIVAGASFTGAGVNFNVTNAYVKFTAYCSSKNNNASSTFNFNVTNSIWDQTGSLVFSEPTNGMDPTINFNLKDSVLESTSHLVFAVTKGEIVFDNSLVNNEVNMQQLENRSALTIKNGSIVYAKHATSSNAKNPGTTIVDNATYIATGEFSGSDVGTGTLIVKEGASVTMGSITNANVVVDATNMNAGDVIDLTANLSNLTGTLEVTGNDTLEAKIVDGKIVLAVKPVAQIGETKYATLQEAIDAAQAGETITLLADVTLDTVITIETAITLDLNDKTITGADGAIVFNVKADTTIKNGMILGNKGNMSSGLIDIYSNLTLNGVTLETSKINALRFKAGGFTATLKDCTVTGAFKGYGGSVWVIESGIYKASSTAISDQLNGSAAISGGTFYYAIDATECAPGYAVVDNGDGTYTVEYAPVCFVDTNNNGVLDDGELVYGSLEAVFDIYQTGDVYVVLTDNVVIENQVDTDVDAKYYLNTNVAEGVTVEFAFADDWNYVQKMYVGENVTLKAPYLLVWTELVVDGTIVTDYLYITVANVTINEGAKVTVNTGDATVQVKNGATLTVNGELNTAILNVWAGESKLIVNGENAKVDASWIDIWDGAPVVNVENGATLEVDSIKSSRGGEITVDGATLDAGSIELGHNGESAGKLTAANNAVVNGELKLTATGSTVAGAGLNVTTDIPDHKVVYDEETKEYKVVAKVYVAQVGETKYESLAEAIDAAQAGETVTLVADVTLEDTLHIVAGKVVTLDLNGYTISQVKEQTAGYQMILNDGKLTINDSVGTGLISYTDSGNGGEYISDTIYNRSVLVINGGTIENISSATVARNGYPHAVDTYSGIRDTSVTINGGVIYCKEYSAIRMFCVSATYEANLVINDGATIKGAIDMQNGTKDSALGSLTINGGTFETTANANNVRFANWNGGATEYGIEAEITGGTFNGGFTTAYVPAAANFNKKFVSGGTFATDISEYCAEGFIAVDNGDGTYGVELSPVRFTGVNLTIAADLSVNFYVTVDDANLDLTNATVTFSFTNTDKVKSFADASVATDGRYVFRFEHVAPQLMGEVITATMKVGDITMVKKYSVKQYCDEALTKEAAYFGYSEAKFATFKTLIADLLNYGAAAQIYTGHNTDALVNVGVTGGSTYTSLKNDSTISGSIDGVEILDARLFFDNTVSLRIYFKAEDVSNLNIVIDGPHTWVAHPTDFVSGGNNEYYVETGELLATELSENYSIHIIEGNSIDALMGGIQIHYGVEDYVAHFQSATGDKLNMANLAKTLWLYGQSAEAFVKAN